MQYPDTEQIAQNDVARTISFLKDKFDNYSLCNNLETIWHDWSVNMMEPEMTFPVMPVSMTISTILPEKNYCKHVQNELLGKTMDLWVTYTLKLILRSFLLGMSLNQGVDLQYYWTLVYFTEAHEMNKEGASEDTNLRENL